MLSELHLRRSILSPFSYPHQRLLTHAQFQPLLIWVDNTALRFVRAHVPRSHLDALADPTKPIIDTLRVEISQPLNMQEREDQIRLMFCLAALLDQHFLVFRPANLMNQTKA